MATKQKQVASCIQCEEDRMLEVRKHASELFAVMDALFAEYGGGHGVSVPEFVAALVSAEKDQRRLVAMIHSDAERRIKDVGSLIAALRFVSDTTKEPYSSGISVGSKAMTIQLTEVFRVAIARLESLIVADKGLLEGRQPQNERDFVKELIGQNTERTYQPRPHS